MQILSRLAVVGFGITHFLIAVRLCGAAVLFDLPEPTVTVPYGTVYLLRATIQNETNETLYLNGVSSTVPEDYAAGDIYDDFFLDSPRTLGPGEGWEGPMLLLTILPETPSQSVIFAVSLSGGAHPYDFSVIGTSFFEVHDSTGVSSIVGTVPERAARIAASPNPFSALTTVRFGLPATEHVSVSIFDVNGRKVRELFQGSLDAGEYRFEWDGRDDGQKLSPGGIYFIRVETTDQRLTTRVVRLG